MCRSGGLVNGELGMGNAMQEVPDSTYRDANENNKLSCRVNHFFYIHVKIQRKHF